MTTRIRLLALTLLLLPASVVHGEGSTIPTGDPNPKGITNLPSHVALDSSFSFGVWERNDSSVEMTAVRLHVRVTDGTGSAAYLVVPATSSGWTARSGADPESSALTPGAHVRELYLHPNASGLGTLERDETVGLGLSGVTANASTSMTIEFSLISAEFYEVVATANSEIGG